MLLPEYISLFFIFLFATALLYLPIFLIRRKKGQGLLRHSSFLLCFWSFFFVVFFTIILFNLPLRFQPEHSVLNLTPLQWLQEGKIKQRISLEIIPNILLFVPLGFFIPIAFRSLRKLYQTALLVLLVTCTIEFLQYFIGRSSDIDDIFANLLGGIIGYVFFKIFHALFKKTNWWKHLLGLST